MVAAAAIADHNPKAKFPTGWAELRVDTSLLTVLRSVNQETVAVDFDEKRCAKRSSVSNTFPCMSTASQCLK